MAVIGGPQSASVKETNSLPSWETRVKPGYSSRGSIHIGILTELPLSPSGNWFLQPGIFYTAKGRKYSMWSDSATAIASDTLLAKQNLSVNYIEIPFNIAYRFPLGGKTSLLLSAGPYLGFFYGGKQVFETRLYASNSYKWQEQPLESGNAEGKIRTFDAGFNGRAGLEIGNVLLTGFFSQGLTSFYQAAYPGSFTHQVRGVSLGIWLNKTRQVAPQPADNDHDGVPDTEDDCPDTAGPAHTRGCPDRDNDGVPDHLDQCPDAPGKPEHQGCPDRDGDGIPDHKDKCPDTPGELKHQGCPDRDGDGIPDETDACPDQPGTAAFNGCPIPDSDGDGLHDQEDDCPAEAGPANNRGCPVIDTVQHIVEQQINRQAQRIFFETGSNRLRPDSKQALDEIVELLKRHSSYKISINGHTDSTGRAATNLRLSQQRAEAVRYYLTQQGIPAANIIARGYGATIPLQSNATAEGRAMNRRVEIRLMQ